MDLAGALDQGLIELKGFRCARESAGRIWVAQNQTDHPSPLRVAAEELRYRLERMGFLVEVAANEPLGGGAAACLHVLGQDGLNNTRGPEQIFVVPRSLLGKLRDLKFEIDQIDLKDASYDNVIAFSLLVQQSLFLARRGADDNKRRLDAARQALR